MTAAEGRSDLSRSARLSPIRHVSAGGETAQRQTQDMVVRAIDRPGGPGRDDEVCTAAEGGARGQAEIDGVRSAESPARYPGMTGGRVERHPRRAVDHDRRGRSPARTDDRRRPCSWQDRSGPSSPGRRSSAVQTSVVVNGEAAAWRHLDRDLDRGLDLVRLRVDPDDRRVVRDARPRCCRTRFPASSGRNCPSVRP